LSGRVGAERGLDLAASTLFSSTAGFSGSSDFGSSAGLFVAISILPSVGRLLRLRGSGHVGLPQGLDLIARAQLSTAAATATADRAPRPCLLASWPAPS